jgi:uncharacterized protein (TIGR04141 family)
LSGIRNTEDDLAELDVDYLRRKYIKALDADNREVHRWSVWRCLTGEFIFEGATYILDEGEIFAVSTDFLTTLDNFIATVPVLDSLSWPPATRSTQEGDFNRQAAASLGNALLMDRENVTARTQTTPVEVCDVLTAGGQLIHVKRHLGSRDLSHLFSQGCVSAFLLQEDSVFREVTSEKIAALTEDSSFRLFSTSPLVTSDFEIVFAILAAWNGRSPAAALPFFSKVNLERAVRELLNRGFRVSLSQVETG